jgi:hypothetical protein
MLRDPNLVPLSRQHHHALALCVFTERGLRGESPDLKHWNAEIARAFASEISVHFQAEEEILFPAIAAHPDLRGLVAQLIAEHAVLRELFGRATRGELDEAGLRTFCEQLGAHVRTEERELFEGAQRLLPSAELDRLGAACAEYFRAAGLEAELCAIPPRQL